ncbi:MAG: hypothetical protein V7640_791 [Betaproteobacteria bacterium]|jgi:hypothetical protein
MGIAEHANLKNIGDFGNPAALERELFRPVTLRPRLSVGLALSVRIPKLPGADPCRAQVCHNVHVPPRRELRFNRPRSQMLAPRFAFA